MARLSAKTFCFFVYAGSVNGWNLLYEKAFVVRATYVLFVWNSRAQAQSHCCKPRENPPIETHSVASISTIFNRASLDCMDFERTVSRCGGVRILGSHVDFKE